MVVPGSALIKKKAEEEGLDQIFKDAGFDWRVAGCSMCPGNEPRYIQPGERCAATSNRNFEGRQGRGAGLTSKPGNGSSSAIEGTS
ncbi:MAG: hypothetical protein Ct9H300mP27_02420 [Chloroflexota bacterium]|nr:MAG: hypothetical protein Ct9H300mP27_02420 [Chloroflexota bacterium]